MCVKKSTSYYCFVNGYVIENYKKYFNIDNQVKIFFYKNPKLKGPGRLLSLFVNSFKTIKNPFFDMTLK